MTRIITCRCGQPLQVTDAMMGRRLGCPRCGQMLQVGPTTVSFGTEPQQSPRKTGTIIALVVGGVVLVLLVVCGGAVFWAVRSVQQIVNRVQVELAESMRRPLKEHDEDYAEARKAFRTRLLFSEPSPQEFDPAYSPPGRKMHFRSGDLSLVAYVDPPPADGQPRPAVLFLHGGCAFGDGDWEMPQPYRDAGFIVMTPVLRGENGQAGTFTLFFDEVDDVLAAADALAGLPYVDKDSIFVSGHSAGGTLATLAAMASDRFRGAASLSGNMNQTLIADFAPFDTSQDVEFEMRSPISFPGSFKCPARLYYGNQEPTLAADTEQTARSASARGLDVAAESSPGDHFSSVPASIQKSIVFFNELRARRADPQ